MLLGYHPGFTQLLYRLGDSPTNAVTPMSPYIWMVLATAQTKYMKDLKIGTLISNLLPIAVILEVIWVVFFIIWYLIGLPIGPVSVPFFRQESCKLSDPAELHN